MKKPLVVCAALSVFILGALGISRALEAPPLHGPFAGRMADLLDMSDDQQTRIQAILVSEGVKNAEFERQLFAYRKQLRQTAKAAAFDESAARAIANSLAQVEIELNVSRARVESGINGVLNAQQRALAEKLGPPMGGKPHGPFPPPVAPEDMDYP